MLFPPHTTKWKSLHTHQTLLYSDLTYWQNHYNLLLQTFNSQCRDSKAFREHVMKMPTAFPAIPQTEHSILVMTHWVPCLSHWQVLGSAAQKGFIQIFNPSDLIIQEIGSSAQKSPSECAQTTDLLHHSSHPQRLSSKTRKRLKCPQPVCVTSTLW